MTLANETTDYLTELTREASEHVRRHGFALARNGELELFSFAGSVRAVFRVTSERDAHVEVAVEDLVTGEPVVEWVEELNGQSFLRNYDDPAAQFLDDLDDLLVAAKRRL